MINFNREMKSSDFVVYNSIDEMVRHLDTFKGGDSSNSTYDPKWYGSATYMEAVERITRGDDDLAKKLNQNEKLDIHIASQGTRRRMMTGVTGFMPHVPNYLANVPNNMIYTREEKVAKRVINIIYGCNTRCEASSRKIAQVSARVVAAIMSLERKGYRINLYASNAAESGSRATGFLVKLKDAGQHIDALKMAFPLLSSSWNRRFGFRFREACGWYDMGSSLNGRDLRKWLDDNKVQYDVAMSYYDAENIERVEELEKLFVETATKIKK